MEEDFRGQIRRRIHPQPAKRVLNKMLPKVTIAQEIERRTLVYAALIFLVFLTLVMVHPNFLLADGDTYWHLVVGECIVRDHAFPVGDQFSYTRAGAPWIAKEWLSQVFLYLAYSIGGWRGVALFTASIAALAFSLIFAWLCRRVAPIVALTMTAVTASLGMGSLLARPRVFFYLMLTICACGLVGAVESRKTPWWLPLLVALWANLHASFPIAIVLAAAFGLEAIASAAPGQRARTAVKWTLVLLGSLAATGLTPHGYGSLLVSLNIVGSKQINAIGEWRPIGFDLMGAYGAAFIAGSLAIVIAARAGWTRAAPIVLCGALMVRHVRFFPLFGIVAAPALATPIARLFPRSARRPSTPKEATGKIALPALGAAWLAAILASSIGPKPVPAPRTAPAAALDAARAFSLSAPVFNDYNFGGYLIYRGVKTFIDGRAELYLGGLFEKTQAAELGKDDAAFLSLLDAYDVTWALLAHNSKGGEKLRRSSQWKEIFDDEYSELFVRS
jgi:hypothetical protein